MFNLFKKKNDLTNYYIELQNSIVQAVNVAHKELLQLSDNNNIFGFALCTDDDVSGFYHVACTKDWVKNKEGSYPGIGYIYVEWEQSGSENIFDDSNLKISKLYNMKYPNEKVWEQERDARFQTLVSALLEIRKNGLFQQDTLLAVGSTDPSDYMESLEMKAVSQLNNSSITKNFADALGYEKYL